MIASKKWNSLESHLGVLHKKQQKKKWKTDSVFSMTFEKKKTTSIAQQIRIESHFSADQFKSQCLWASNYTFSKKILFRIFAGLQLCQVLQKYMVVPAMTLFLQVNI